MTIQDYLNKIEALQRKKTKIAFLDDDDFEFCVQKINQSAESFFMLDDLLQKFSVIHINSDIVKLSANGLGLLFLEERESGNICFASSDELRPEYRQSFKLVDFLDYVYAFMHSLVYKESQKIIVPSEKDFFWKLAKIGSDLRK
ncbi:hypothetical protein ABXT06_09040 [Flavobacterium sp. UW10123]|uniref:hypothetical protein n=1 Tax=Flavobacterium sp. UW10123 TaxID=3230800 RepID=UPI0033936914